MHIRVAVEGDAKTLAGIQCAYLRQILNRNFSAQQVRTAPAPLAVRRRAPKAVRRQIQRQKESWERVLKDIAEKKGAPLCAAPPPASLSTACSSEHRMIHLVAEDDDKEILSFLGGGLGLDVRARCSLLRFPQAGPCAPSPPTRRSASCTECTPCVPPRQVRPTCRPSQQSAVPSDPPICVCPWLSHWGCTETNAIEQQLLMMFSHIMHSRGFRRRAGRRR